MARKIIHFEDYNLAHNFILGDDKSGKKLYASIFDKLKRFIYSYTKNGILIEADVEDVFADTLEISIEKLKFYTGESSFYTFICGIAKNKIKEKTRKKSKDIKILEDLKEAEESVCDYDEPLDILIEKELISAVKQALNELSQNHRDILNATNMKLTAKEIKEFAGLSSEEAVYSMYRRAISSLKENFKKIYNKNDQF